MLKVYFVERHKAKDIAKQFGLSHFTVYSVIRDFKESVDRSEPMQFFVETKTGVPAENSVLVYTQGFTYNCRLSKNYQK
ncbi:MAG: hypothetical protein ACYSUJ_14455 [Planctomycetota bacterium]|jgi:transposase